MGKQLFAEVIINNKCKETDRIYNYEIPEELQHAAKIGCRAIVPFGLGNKATEAYIIGIVSEIDIKLSRIKKLHRIIDDTPVISKELLELAIWMKQQYLCFYVDTLQTVIPTPVRTKNSFVIEINSSNDIDINIKTITSETLLEIIDYIESNNGKVNLLELKEYFNNIKIDYYIKKLLDLGIVIKKQNITNKIQKRMQKHLYLNENVNVILHQNANKQNEIIDTIRKIPGISYSKLKEICQCNNSSINALIDKKYINTVETDDYRNISNRTYLDYKHKLTLEQVQAVEKIEESFIKNRNVLLHGVTGSGKTEVYLEIIERYIAQEKDAIVLVPEISLTPQMISRFKGRFGAVVAVLHSNLSEGEKYDEWRKIKSGVVKVAVGARSAVFAPFSNLGIIIIDEEHENTYKSDIKPKYLTREVAEKRCQLEGAHLILGSATPSIETYYRSQIRELELVEMLNRVNGRPMPSVEIVDMREELIKGNKTIFSDILTEGILDTLKDNNQIILFLNRRGHSTFVSCRECGLVMKCPRCSISLTYHINDNKLTCHYCGFERQNPDICPKCNSKYIKYFGVGTQKLEKEFVKKFGINNILRMDADTTSKKNSHEVILEQFRNKESRVLLGTQMISKGLDFPDVTLVGVITADTSINLPDFRAAEKTFQMIAQVAGRAGRGEKHGKVIVQTYSPEHYSILYAKDHDFKGFYQQEIRLRRELAYPPFSYIANMIISGSNEQNVIKAANEINTYFEREINKIKDIEKLGPISAPIAKLKNRYRWQLLVKSKSRQNIKSLMMKFIESNTITINDVNVSIDLNPQNML